MTNPQPPRDTKRPASRVRSRRLERGFTLSELMIASTAGLLVSFAAFLLSKNATAFFQNEARLSSAQLAASLGMSRLTADIQRAGFLATPRMQVDPARCGDPTPWPTGLRNFQSVRIEADTTATTWSSSVLNGLTPQRITLGGAFHSVEQFPIRAVVPGANGAVTLVLATQSGAMYRTLKDAADAATVSSTLTRLFPVGRMLRIVDAVGRHEYGIVQAITITGTPPTRVDLALSTTVPLPQQAGPGTCGYNGFGTGMLLNPIALVQYRLQNLAGDARFGALVAPVNPGVTGDDQRLELVRVELDSAGAEIADTRELVAEYAVDLRFGVTVGNELGTNTQTLTRHPITTGGLTAGFTAAVQTPERMRNLQVRLSTRGRAPDRETDIGTAFSDGRRLRYGLALAGNQTRFARMRTLYADVALQNHAGITW